MDQKDFLISLALAGLTSFGGSPKTNFDKCRAKNIVLDVDEQLDQGLFTIDNISIWQVVMTTTPGMQRQKLQYEFGNVRD